MSRAGVNVAVREEGPAPVTILDGLGRVLRVVPAEEFRRDHPAAERPALERRRRRGERAQTGEVEQTAAQTQE